MSSLAAINNTSDVVATLLGSFFVLTTFLVNHGKKRNNEQKGLRRRFLRTSLIWLVVLSFAAKCVPVALGHYEFERSLNRIIAILFFATVLSLVSSRKTLVFVEIFSLSVVSLVYSATSLMLEWTGQASTASNAIPKVQTARLFVIARLIAKCLTRCALNRKKY